jgi:benzoyl-CoA reductase/2-hydroxyglutaryl-CoA dehydratase subunit BcrC/BadD/HgdB
MARKEQGWKIVGIMCEYTPREIIMAAGGVPVCLCGGSRDMIEPAEGVLPSNLCPLIKSTFGYSLEKENPFLEMADLIVAETTCDGKKKMYELLAERHPMHILELPQRSRDPDSFERWVAELNALKYGLEERFNVKITRENLRDAIRVMNRERKLKRELAGLMKAEEPPLTGRELLDMKSLISGMSSDAREYEKALSMLPGRELPASYSRRVRVLLTGVPLPHGAERVMDLIESNGGLVVCQENCTGLKPLLEDVDEDAEDPVRALAEKYYRLPCSVMTKNEARMDSLKALAAEYRPECVVELVWQACITYDVESSLVKRLAEDVLDMAYLRIETDYSPTDNARIAVRVEALFETVKGRAGS